MNKKYLSVLFTLAIALSGCSVSASTASVSNVTTETVAVHTAAEVQYKSIDLNLSAIELDTSIEGFTYYDTNNQSDIQSQIDALKANVNGTDDMLAIFNPYGTNTTGLYLYFVSSDTDSISYTISADGTSDFTATANDLGTGNAHEICLIGLVAGMQNNVTLQLYNSYGEETYNISFSVTAPDLKSGYVTSIQKTSGTSTQALSNGLYLMMGLNSTYAGYSFLVDNDGVIREELVTQGDMVENIKFYNGDMYLTSDLYQMAAISPLGKVDAVYNTGINFMHHDFAMTSNGVIIALADDTTSSTVEDIIVSIDTASGEVSELIDMGDLLPDYKSMTHNFSPDDTLSVANGEWDWIHLNTIQLVNDDEMIVSSRETSTIIKISNIYSNPTLDYLISDEQQWADTSYSSYVLTKASDFNSQFGQHTVTYVADNSLPDGQYYLIMYDNNYYCEDSNDLYFSVPDDVNQSFLDTGDNSSYYYAYLVDENANTYDLVDSFPVTYSSIVSSVQQYGSNIIIDSGVANEFSEYDSEGNVISTFYYDPQDVIFCTYRVFKYDFSGYYFAG